MAIRPLEGSSRPTIRRAKVLLPLPLSPTMPTNSHSRRVKLTSRTAVSSKRRNSPPDAKRLVRPDTSRIVASAALFSVGDTAAAAISAVRAAQMHAAKWLAPISAKGGGARVHSEIVFGQRGANAQPVIAL